MKGGSGGGFLGNSCPAEQRKGYLPSTGILEESPAGALRPAVGGTNNHEVPQSITEQDSMNLVHLQTARLKGSALRRGSRKQSSSGACPDDIRHGKDKDFLSLPRILDVVLCALAARMPE